MKKTSFIIVLIAFLVSCQSQIKERAQKENSAQNTTEKVVYTEKYGLKFIKPKTWKLVNEDVKSINLQSEIMSLETNYADLQNNSYISFKLHPGQRGKELYKSFKNDLNNEFKPIHIGTKKALQKIVYLKTDGKGHDLKTPITRIITSVLILEGETEIIFNAKSENAVESFNNFLSLIIFK